MAKAPTKSKGKPGAVRAARTQRAGRAVTSKTSTPKPKAKSSSKSANSPKKPGAGPAKAAAKAPAKSKQSPAGKVKRTVFDAKALAEISKGLIEERQDLLEQLAEIEEAAFSPEQSEASGEAGYDDDYADAGTATFEREKDLSIANNIQDLIDKINKALDKITEGTYGICESCGQPISADRLKALPHVLLCIKCKKAEERR